MNIKLACKWHSGALILPRRGVPSFAGARIFQGVSHEDPTDSPEHPSRHAWVVAQILTHPDHP